MADEVNIKDDSKHRVAFDLMNRIAIADGKGSIYVKNAAEYFFTLYEKSLRVVDGESAKDVLNESK